MTAPGAAKFSIRAMLAKARHSLQPLSHQKSQSIRLLPPAAMIALAPRPAPSANRHGSEPRALLPAPAE
jgi:hypothetical protein